MSNQGVKEEALVGMIKALDKFREETAECIMQLQKDANTCQINMDGDVYSTKAIARVNACLERYKQLYYSAGEIRDNMFKTLHRLDEISGILDGDDY